MIGILGIGFISCCRLRTWPLRLDSAGVERADDKLHKVTTAGPDNSTTFGDFLAAVKFLWNISDQSSSSVDNLDIIEIARRKGLQFPFLDSDDDDGLDDTLRTGVNCSHLQGVFSEFIRRGAVRPLYVGLPLLLCCFLGFDILKRGHFSTRSIARTESGWWRREQLLGDLFHRICDKVLSSEV